MKRTTKRRGGNSKSKSKSKSRTKKNMSISLPSSVKSYYKKIHIDTKDKDKFLGKEYYFDDIKSSTFVLGKLVDVKKGIYKLEMDGEIKTTFGIFEMVETSEDFITENEINKLQEIDDDHHQLAKEGKSYYFKNKIWYSKDKKPVYKQGILKSKDMHNGLWRYLMETENIRGIMDRQSVFELYMRKVWGTPQ